MYNAYWLLNSEHGSSENDLLVIYQRNVNTHHNVADTKCKRILLFGENKTKTAKTAKTTNQRPKNTLQS